MRWEVYYHSDGSLDARFFKSASVRPHGELSIREFYSSGRWWIKGIGYANLYPSGFMGARFASRFGVRKINLWLYIMLLAGGYRVAMRVGLDLKVRFTRATASTKSAR